jgi:Beta-propeller repeat
MRSIFRLSTLVLVAAFARAGNVSLPLFFMPNAGVADSQFQYLAQTPRFRAAFAPDKVVFQLTDGQIQLRFPGAQPSVRISGTGDLAGRVNFLTGSSPAAWHTQVPTSSEIVYRGLYSGIDLVYLGAGNELKSEFRLEPFADPAQIRLRYSQSLTIAANGDLLVQDREAELREKAPEVYQETSQGRVKIEAHYVLQDANTAAFALGEFDSSKPLIIDPVISYATYLGGTNSGAITSTAVDASGNLYVAGWTAASDFPTYSNVGVAAGGLDAIVAKLNSTGTVLIYATYIGGIGADQAFGIAVDSLGEAVVTGSTASLNFPLASPIRSTLAGSKAAFVAKLSAGGNALIFSTYLAGTTYDAGTAVALDSSGNAWVTGDTQSANFPMVGALQPNFGGATDVFIAKITPTGALAASTFWGGSGAEHAGAIAVDTAGNVYVVGGTYSTNFPLHFPTQSTNAGGQDAFVLELNASATAVRYATYLGGNGSTGSEQANGIAIDPGGYIYITGVTNSANFPVTTGAVQTTYGGLQDAFVTKINASGPTIIFSTYLGGSNFDWASGIAVDTAGNAYITGYTSSLNYPTTGPVQPTLNNAYDAFVSMLNTTGGVLAFSTYYGGSGIDQANAIAIDGSGNMYIGGQTNSSNLPLQTPYQSTNTGGAVGWVARIGVTAPQAQTPAVVSVTPSAGSGANVVFTATYSDTGGGSALNSVSLLVNTGATSNFGCMVTYTASTNLFSLANDSASSGSTTTVPGGTNIQNSQCTLNGTTSSVSISGNTLTLSISLYFQPSFAGAHSIYLSATDAGATTGLVSLGTWTATVPAPQPSVTSVSPSSGTGFAQTFVFTFGDASSANNLADVAVLFGPSQTYTNSCYIVVDLLKNTIALLWNNALGSNSKPIGSATLLNNSQCSIGANNIVLSGQSLALTRAITFTAPFNGAKNVYMQAAEVGINTGWIQKGTYNVLALGSPQATSVVPNAGSGTGQRFSFTMTDLGGSANLGAMAMLFNSSLNLNNACSLVWDGSRGTISLAWDVQSLGATPVVPGTNQTASNAQCTINAANSTVAYSATTVTVTVDISFNASFNGTKNIYLFAAEVNSNSGWANVGTWTVTSGSPVANSVSPSSGAGHFPTFTFNASDSANQANITSGAMLFTTGSPSNIANACYVFFNRTAGTVGLYDDSGTVLNTKGFGASSPLSNSQCAVGYAGIGLPGGNNVQFILQLQFTTGPFSGAKTVYFDVNEPSATTGWVSSGTWTTQ